MFKKSSLFVSFLLPISLFSAQIVDYNATKHEKAVTEIVFQDPNQLFADSSFFNRMGCLFAGFGLVTGLAGRRLSNSIGRNALYGVAIGWGLASGYTLLDNQIDFSSRKKKELEATLTDNKNNKSVLIDTAGNVVGFITTLIAKEQSIEALREKCEKLGRPLTLTDEQCKKFFPAFKSTEAECKKFLMIECLAVSRAHRGKRYGTQLINDIIEKAKKEGVAYADIDVVNTNKGAKKMYERLGFVPINTDSLMYRLLNITHLRKELT